MEKYYIKTEIIIALEKHSSVQDIKQTVEKIYKILGIFSDSILTKIHLHN